MVKLNKIYTRTGDDGTTGLVDGSRIAKSDALMEAIGDVDEANSALGIAVAALPAGGEAAAMFARIQNELFDLGADLATPADPQHGFGPHEMALRIVASQIARLEAEIDAMNDERAAVAASATRPLNPLALAYLNRLSDHLFVATRHLNAAAGGDILWKPGATR
jgi:cob(I)alamin adenosyltransferase